MTAFSEWWSKDEITLTFCIENAMRLERDRATTAQRSDPMAGSLDSPMFQDQTFVYSHRRLHIQSTISPISCLLDTAVLERNGSNGLFHPSRDRQAPAIVKYSTAIEQIPRTPTANPASRPMLFSPHAEVETDHERFEEQGMDFSSPSTLPTNKDNGPEDVPRLSARPPDVVFLVLERRLRSASFMYSQSTSARTLKVNDIRHSILVFPLSLARKPCHTSPPALQVWSVERKKKG